MAKAVVNPYGLRLRNHPELTGDFPVSALQDLYARFMERRSDNHDIDMICDLVDLVRQCGFGQLSFWNDQFCNPYLYGANQEFVEETFAFILGAERNMRPQTWSHLIEYSDERKPMRDVRNCNMRTLADVPGKLSEFDLVELWVKRPEGVADMLCTMYVLFCGNPLN